ncbi:GntR family transcriptional regulator [Marinilactibacillus psychrotolerans]|uniref:GntR family transcriptional regulator n=1 Tax=Marinilactibacillus psychrotolerans TaxID=191770 RepID=UPI003885F99F
MTNQIKQSILCGELTEGELLPSIRVLAKDLKVSIITTKRAYEELERGNYVTSIVGKGTYVAKQDIEIHRQKQLIKIEKNIRTLIYESKLISLNLKDIQGLIEKAYKEEL